MNGVDIIQNTDQLLPFSIDPKATIKIEISPDQTVSDDASNEYTDIEISQGQDFGRFVFISPEIRAYYDWFVSGYNQGYLKAFQDINTAAKEMVSLQMETELSELRKDIRSLNSLLNTNLTDIKESLAKVQEDTKHISTAVDTLQRDTKDLPALRVKIDSLEKSSVWWKQYLLAPTATVVIGGILLAIAKYAFHLF